MTTLSDLTERLEKATGPDRELDAMLHVIVAERREWQVHGNTFYAKRLEAPHDTYRIGSIDPGEHQRNFSASSQFPRYTASIDAALSLVERVLPGYRWGVAFAPMKTGFYPDGKPSYGDGFKAHLTEPSALRPMPTVTQGPTAPLAILIALLRARSHTESQT